MHEIKVSIAEYPKICKTLKISINTPHKLTAQMQNVTIYTSDIEVYDGQTVVNPTFEQQSLNTKNKRVSENINILPIEVTRLQNSAGGNTIIIGGSDGS